MHILLLLLFLQIDFPPHSFATSLLFLLWYSHTAFQMHRSTMYICHFFTSRYLKWYYDKNPKNELCMLVSEFSPCRPSWFSVENSLHVCWPHTSQVCSCHLPGGLWGALGWSVNTWLLVPPSSLAFSPAIYFFERINRIIQNSIKKEC